MERRAWGPALLASLLVLAGCSDDSTPPTNSVDGGVDAALVGDTAADAATAVDTAAPDVPDAPAQDARDVQDLGAPDTDSETAADASIDADAPPDSGPDVAPDTEADAQLDTETDTQPDTQPDTFVEPPPEPGPCQTRPPALLFGDLIVSDDLALRSSPMSILASSPPPIASWDTGARVSPASVLPAGDDGAEIFVTVATAGGCDALGLSGDGGEVWSHSMPTAWCRAPVVHAESGSVLVPFADGAGGGAVRVLSRLGGNALEDIPLPGVPATPAVRAPWLDGVVSNGGSHWLVGTVGAIAVVRVGQADLDPPSALVTWLDVPDATVTSVFPIDIGVVGATARNLPEAPDHLGARILRVTIGDVAGELLVQPLGDPIQTPAPMQAPPVAALDCEGPTGSLSNGGSHWWCPAGIVVAGGAEWLGGWEVTSGESIFQESPEGITLTGLALGANELVYNGGSHWLPDPDGWVVRVTDASVGVSAELDKGLADGPTCVASPIVDSSGTVVAAISTEAGATSLVAVSTPASGLGPGWARTGGDNTNTNAPKRSDAPCPGGDVLLYERTYELGPTLDVRAVTGTFDGGVVIAGRKAEADSDGHPWMARLDAYGRGLWELSYPQGNPAEIPFRAVAMTAAGVVAISDIEGAALVPQTRLLLVSSETGEVLQSSTMGDGVVGRQTRAMVANVDGSMTMVGEFPAAPEGTPDHYLVRAIPGQVPTLDIPFTGPGSARPAAVAALGTGGWVMVGDTSSSADQTIGAMIRGTDPEGTQTWIDTVIEDGFQHLGEAVAVTPSGVVAMLGRRADSTGDITQAYIRTYSGDGSFQGMAELGDLKGLAIAVAGDGRLMVLGEHFETVALTEAGAAAVTRQHGQGLLASLIGGAVGLPGGGFVAAGSAIVDPAAPDQARAFVVRLDPWGVAGCGQAGRCVGADAVDCDDLDPCTADRCVPESGECEHLPLADATPCGPSQTCNAGLCQ